MIRRWISGLGTLLLATSTWAGEKHTAQLKTSGELGIPYEECKQVENEVGQLLYATAYGFEGAKTGQAIDPHYVTLARDLNLGGVLPHYETDDISKIRAANEAFKRATDPPALVSVDYFSARRSKSDEKGRFGLGFGTGFIGKHGRDLSNTCIQDLGYLEAFFHKTAGLNHTLGPTVEHGVATALGERASEVPVIANELLDRFHEFGIATTLKHYPYTPQDYNLHHKTEDTRLPATQVTQMLENFKRLGPNSDFVMSTHLINSKIDPKDVATFSEKWVGILRNELGFKGLLMTDALFMFNHYEDSVRAMVRQWKPEEKRKVTDEISIFAARAILSGHDMVFLDGNAESTRKVFNDLHYIACQNTENGRKLRARISESFHRIRDYKKLHAKALAETLRVPDSDLKKAFELYSRIKSGKACGSPEMKDFQRRMAGRHLEAIQSMPSLPIQGEQNPCPNPNGGSIEVQAEDTALVNLGKALKEIKTRSYNGKTESELLNDRKLLLEALRPPVDEQVKDIACADRQPVDLGTPITLQELDPKVFESAPAIVALGCLAHLEAGVISKIAEGLDSPDGAMRAAAAEALERPWPFPAQVTSKLARLARDPDPEVRYRALFSLQSKPEHTLDPEALSAVVAALEDPDSLNRSMAAGALGLSQTKDPEIHLKLLELSKSREVRLADRASDALQSLHPTDPRVLDKLSKALASKDKNELEHALGLLRRLGVADPKLQRQLAQLAPHANSYVATAAIEGLSSFDGKDPQILSALLKAAQGTDPSRKEAAMRVLNNCPSSDPRIVDALLTAARSKDDSLRYAAVRGFTRKGSGDPRVDEQVLKLAQDANSSIRSQAFSILEDRGSKLPRAQGIVLQSLSDPDSSVRSSAARAAVKLLPSDPGIQRKYAELLPSLDSGTLAQILPMFGKYKQLDASIQALVAKSAAEKSSEARNEALNAMQSWEDISTEALTEMVPMISDSDGNVRDKAISILRSKGSQKPSRKLESLLAQQLESSDSDTRSQILFLMSSWTAQLAASGHDPNVERGIAMVLGDFQAATRTQALQYFVSTVPKDRSVQKMIAQALYDIDSNNCFLAARILYQLKPQDPEIQLTMADALSKQDAHTRNLLENLFEQLPPKDPQVQLRLRANRRN